MGIGALRWLFATCPFDSELMSIDGGVEGWAGSMSGSASEGSDGAASGKGSNGGGPVGRDDDRGFQGGDVSAPAGVRATPAGGNMSGLISRARDLSGETDSTRRGGPIWRKGSLAAGASSQEAAPSVDEQTWPRGMSTGSP